MKKRILFYSSVSTLELFETQKFYKIDIDILTELNCAVKPTNKITDFLFFWKYDMAFIYFYKFGFFVSAIAKFFCKKVFFTGGIDDLDENFASASRFQIQKLFFRLCYLFSDKCILVSSSDSQNVRKIYNGVLPKKVVMSFHTIEVEKFLCNDISQKGVDFTTIAWMGNEANVIRKGVDLSLKLFSLLLKNYSEYKHSKFIIIGKKGSGTSYLEALSDELNISDRVVFTDEVDEQTKVDLLKKGRYYMQLSKYEGFGIAATEALAAQNIVINSGRGGLTDSVGKYGVLVDIDLDITKQLVELHERIQSIDYGFLKAGEQYVVANFSYNLRKNDFKKIIFD